MKLVFAIIVAIAAICPAESRPQPLFENITNFFDIGGWIDTIKNKLNSLYDSFKDKLADLIQGAFSKANSLLETISSVYDSITEKLQNTIGAVKKFVDSILDDAVKQAAEKTREGVNALIEKTKQQVNEINDLAKGMLKSLEAKIAESIDGVNGQVVAITQSLLNQLSEDSSRAKECSDKLSPAVADIYKTFTTDVATCPAEAQKIATDAYDKVNQVVTKLPDQIADVLGLVENCFHSIANAQSLSDATCLETVVGDASTKMAEIIGAIQTANTEAAPEFVRAGASLTECSGAKLDAAKSKAEALSNEIKACLQG